MTKFNILLFFGIFFCSLQAFSQSDINKMDSQGQRHGVWKKTYPGTEQLRYEGVFEHGKEVGDFKFYCEECKDQPSVIKSFNDKSDIANVQYFSLKGKLISEGKMKGKERIGEWLYYHENSNQVMTREHYENGKLHGKLITYYPNGQITETTAYKHGLKHGEDKYYSPEGILLKNLFYHNDKLHGEATYFDGYGNVLIKGSYKNGKKHGLWQYYKDGKISLEETFPKTKEK